MEGCPRSRGKEQTLGEGHHDSSSMRGFYFIVLTRGYSYGVLTKKKLNKQWRKHILAHVEHTNQGLNFIFASKEWATTGQR